MSGCPVAFSVEEAPIAAIDPEVVALAGGRAVVIRPLATTDEAALAEAFTRLSDTSRRLRFGYVAPALGPAAMRHLVGSVDGVDHVALVAHPVDVPKQLVGVARILRYPHDPLTLDVGITVADDYQGDGLGRALAVRLAEHRPRPAARIVTQVEPDNDRVIPLLTVFGLPTRRTVTGEVEICLENRVRRLEIRRRARPQGCIG